MSYITNRCFKRLVKRAGDACAICREPFGIHTYAGQRGGKLHYVGECCADRLDTIAGVGLFFSRDEPPWRAADHVWFEKNPTRSHRVRAVMPGEHEGGDWVIVRQIEPGTRHRVVFTCESPPPDDERHAHVLFDLILEARAAGRSSGISSPHEAGGDFGRRPGMTAVIIPWDRPDETTGGYMLVAATVRRSVANGAGYAALLAEARSMNRGCDLRFNDGVLVSIVDAVIAASAAGRAA